MYGRCAATFDAIACVKIGRNSERERNWQTEGCEESERNREKKTKKNTSNFRTFS